MDELRSRTGNRSNNIQPIAGGSAFNRSTILLLEITSKLPYPIVLARANSSSLARSQSHHGRTRSFSFFHSHSGRRATATCVVGTTRTTVDDGTTTTKSVIIPRPNFREAPFVLSDKEMTLLNGLDVQWPAGKLRRTDGWT